MATMLLHDYLRKVRSDARQPVDDAFPDGDLLLRVMFDQSSLLMGVLRPDGTVLKINSTAYRAISAEQADVVGKPFWETPWWSHSQQEQEQVRQAVQAAARGEFVRFEASHPTPDGGLIYVDFSLKPVKDDAGNVVLLLPEGREITQRKLAEESLGRSYALLRVMFDQSSLLMGLLTPEGTVLKINSTAFGKLNDDADAFHLFSYGGLHVHEADVVGKPFWETPWWTHDPEQQQRLIEAIKEAAGGGFVRFEATHPTDGGDLIYVDFSLKPVLDDAGKVVMLIPEGRDITDSKKTQQRNLRLASIVDSSDDAIIGKTLDGIITSWNKGAEMIFQYRESEVLGQPITMLIPPQCVEEVLQVHDRIRRGEHIDHFETLRRRKDGALIDMSLTFSPIKDPQGRVVAVSTIGRDITEQKRASRFRLENARLMRELEIAKEIQQSFLPVCPPSLPGLLMTCRCVPAMHVGGDYYDYFELGNGVVDAVIADVTGHSVGSSLLMAMARSVLKAKASTSRSPGHLLSSVNNLLHADLSRADLQMSMFYVRLDLSRKTLTYANAGHVRPLLYRRREGACQELDADGLLMGIRRQVTFEERRVAVEPEDILILCTDGITEAEDATGEMFGSQRLGKVIADCREEHPQVIMDAIFHEMSGFVRADDVAMIIFKVQ